MIIKICGLKRKKDITDCCKLGVGFLGFNFYQKSKRYVKPENLKKVICSIPEKTKKIGVFVNSSTEEIRDVVEKRQLDGIQLHGNETLEFCIKIRKIFPDKIIIKAFRINKRLPGNIDKYPVDYFLFDSADDRNFGGTGKTFDWSVLKKLEDKNIKFFVSGGINSKNVKKLFFVVKPSGIDVASGVEKKPGIKDIKKIKSLLKAIKSIIGEQE
ncbi:MAG: phosphoribosylanthranilate isomerase [Candidatus Omnitrophica bacterium]|nr:phosphoribosylanthranilate isomerase [Candidatus Omnitrophota bacterium]